MKTLDRRLLLSAHALVLTVTAAAAAGFDSIWPLAWVFASMAWGALGSWVERATGRIPERLDPRAVAPFAILLVLVPWTAPPLEGDGARILALLLIGFEILLVAMRPSLPVVRLEAMCAAGMLLPLSFLLATGPFVIVASAVGLLSARFWIGMQARRFPERLRRRRRSAGRTTRPAALPPRVGLARFSLVASWIGVVLFLSLPRFAFRDLLPEQTRSGVSPSRVDFGPSRTTTPGRRAASQEFDPRLGFREDAFLSNLGRIEEDDEIVLRARFEDRQGGATEPPSWPVRMRGIVLDRYERGGHWYNASLERAIVTDREDRREDGWTDLYTPPSAETTTVHARVELRPVGSAAVFALAEPVRLRLPEARVDAHGSIYFADNPDRTVVYDVESRIPTSSPAALGSATRFPLGDPRFLQLPRPFPRVRRLAARIVAGLGSRYEVCRAIETHLQRSYEYTLAFDAATDSDLVEHFLFETQSGYCVHFASSMVVMLRTLGIPARVACGFSSDERGQEPGEVILRRRDSHAWVEVDFGRYGWIAFDPTGAGRDAALDSEPSWIEAALDYLSRFGDAERRAILNALGGAARWILPVVLFGFVVATAFVLRRRQRGPRDGAVANVIRTHGELGFYEEMIRRMAIAGVRRRPDETPLELAARARAYFPAEIVDRLTRAFCDARYGNRPLAPTESQELGHLARTLSPIDTPGHGGAGSTGLQ